jgi:hypothetical protein
MKRYFVIAIVLLNFIAFGQVGINTTNPIEELHIANATSSVRVDGLNFPNNANNLGNGNTSRVFVDAEGDLVLGAATNNIEIVFNPFNYLEDPQTSGGATANVINQTGTGSGYTSAGWPRVIGAGSSTFTLTRPAIVEINYSLSWLIEKSGNPIDDGHARIVQTFMVLRSGGPSGALVSVDYEGVPITLGGALGLNGQFHSNLSAIGASGHPYDVAGTANDIVNKYCYNTGTDYIKLGPGTYCPMFYGQCAVGDTGGTGAVKMWIGGGQDEVQIIAHYYN